MTGAVVAGVAGAVGLWVLWLYLADSVAYRAPYDLWLCRIENGGVIGDPFLTFRRLGLKFVLLLASFAVVALIVFGVWRRGEKRWRWFAAAVLIVAVTTCGYVAAIDAMLYPGYEVPECG
ncbi:hypothetical protein [Amycolatopsis minnesotensis]|uniref:hypothetical protein n=1 Tax=Amycolatopsis minnesotensis TaxID=337894 RepID=UPI0031CE9F4A